MSPKRLADLASMAINDATNYIKFERGAGSIEPDDAEYSIAVNKELKYVLRAIIMQTDPKIIARLTEDLDNLFA